MLKCTMSSTQFPVGCCGNTEDMPECRRCGFYPEEIKRRKKLALKQCGDTRRKVLPKKPRAMVVKIDSEGNITEYVNAHTASSSIGVPEKLLYKALNGKIDTLAGCRWEYAVDNPR